MKKFLTILIMTMLTSPAFSQTAEELTKQLEKLQIENTSLTARNTGYNNKLKDKQKEIERKEKEYNQLLTKREQSRSACQGISDENINIMLGLSAGTIAISGVGTASSAVNIATTVKGKIDAKNNDEASTMPPNNNSKVIKNITNITSTATSVGSTITSAIALSKADGLKSEIEKCLDSFN